MSSLNEVVNGLKKYVDAEILPKVTGWNKWVFGAGVSLMLENSANVFNQLKENPFIKNMGVISKEDEIDIEKLYSVFLEQSKKSAVTFAVPLLGNLTLKSNDIEKLYNLIKSSEVRNES